MVNSDCSLHYDFVKHDLSFNYVSIQITALCRVFSSMYRCVSLRQWMCKYVRVCVSHKCSVVSRIAEGVIALLRL